MQFYSFYTILLRIFYISPIETTTNKQIGGYMSLANLKREYEERRAALVQQLQNNAKLNPATQHQIYGAIKEIENFLRTIDYQLGVDQEKNIQVELERAKPSPFVEKTNKMVTHVAKGTKRLFTEHIPNTAKGAYNRPKQAVANYFDKKREEARVRAEIEAEVRRRLAPQQSPEHPHPHLVLEHPHQELDVKTVGEHVPVIEAHEKREAPMTPMPPKTMRVRPALKAKRGHMKKPHQQKQKGAKNTRGR